jgi:hypothetical protein
VRRAPDVVKLYVCWATGGGPKHSCGAAHDALKEAGHRFEVGKAYSTRLLPNALQITEGRKEAIRRTGKSDVPILILDDDTTVAGSKAIVDWAKANPAA